MAKRTGSEYDRYIWGHWNPETHSDIYLDNNAYDRLMHELSVLRKKPQKANPQRMLDLIAQMQQTWDRERQQYQTVIDQILAECEEELNRLYSEGKKQYDLLAKEISNIRQQIKRQQEQQQELKRNIDAIEREADRDKQIAHLNCQQAIEMFDSIKEDPYWKKYNVRDLNELVLKVNQINNTSPAVVLQTIALDIMTVIKAGQKEVDHKRIEYLSELAQANGQIDQALQLISHYENDLYYDSDSDNPQEKIDIDYWTYNEFSSLVHYIREVIVPRMRNSTITPGYMVENLRQDRELLKGQIERIDRIVPLAITSLRNSKTRVQLALLATSELVRQYYFTLTLDGYDDDDDRLGYVVYLNNPALNINLRLVLNPVHGSDNIDTICHYAYNRYIDYNIEQKLYDDIKKTLLDLGIVLSETEKRGQTFSSQQDEDEIVPSTDRIHLSEHLKAQKLFH